MGLFCCYVLCKGLPGFCFTPSELVMEDWPVPSMLEY